MNVDMNYEFNLFCTIDVVAKMLHAAAAETAAAHEGAPLFIYVFYLNIYIFRLKKSLLF